MKTNITAKVYNLNQWDIVGDGRKRREELTVRGKLQVQTSLKCSIWSRRWWCS